jgi:hypothetical protein
MADTVTLRLNIADPAPGVRYSLQDLNNAPVDARTGGDGPLSFDVPVTLRPDGRLSGPFIRREGPMRRFVYIAIGQSAGDCASVWTRRAKIDVHDIPAALLRPDAVVEVSLPGRGKDGSPACATVRPIERWRAANRR